MQKETKFIKNVIKQFEKYKDYLNFQQIPQGVQVTLNKYSSGRKPQNNQFNPVEFEKFLTDIIINNENKYVLFANSWYVHPLKNLVKSLNEYKLNETEQSNILNKFFTYQNTHDLIEADPTNLFFLKYIKPQGSKAILATNNSYNHNNSLGSLAKSLTEIIKDCNEQQVHNLLQGNFQFFLQNYKTDDKYGIDTFHDFLTESCSKELYAEFNQCLNIKPKESNPDELFSVTEKKEYVLKLDSEKIEHHFLLFKNEMAKSLFKNFLTDFFTPKNKDLHHIDFCEVFTTSVQDKEIITVIFTSEKELEKEKLKKDTLFFLKLFNEKLNFNDLPSSVYRTPPELKEGLNKLARSAIMNRDLGLSIQTEAEPKEKPTRTKLKI